MEVSETIQSVRSLVKSARDNGKIIGLVPTMGALHVGHISLIEAAKKKCDYVVVSIFVNPTQFVPGEDFEKYPRPFEADLYICQKAGVAAVFAPSPEEMYPAENITWVKVEKITEPLCGQFRPGHFQGVTTVCSKLFNIVAPDFAFFGQKDAQQAIVISLGIGIFFKRKFARLITALMLSFLLVFIYPMFAVFYLYQDYVKTFYDKKELSSNLQLVTTT